MYYSQKINFSKSFQKQDYGFPKLQVTYNKLNKKWKDKTGLLKISNYVSFINDRIVGISKQQNYEIIDLRKKQTNKQH